MGTNPLGKQGVGTMKDCVYIYPYMHYLNDWSSLKILVMLMFNFSQNAMPQFARRLNESYNMQERLAAENADLEGKR